MITHGEIKPAPVDLLLEQLGQLLIKFIEETDITSLEIVGALELIKHEVITVAESNMEKQDESNESAGSG